MNTDAYNLIGEKVLEYAIGDIIYSYIKPDPVYENMKLLAREIETINTFNFEKYYNTDPSMEQVTSVMNIPTTASKMFCYISFMAEVEIIAKLNKNFIVNRINESIDDCNLYYKYDVEFMYPSMIAEAGRELFCYR